MVQQSKMQANSVEMETVTKTHPVVVLRQKKPEQILAEVRSRKIAEMNQYKDVPAEKKFKDIQSLLQMMNTHGNLPSKLKNADVSDA